MTILNFLFATFVVLFLLAGIIMIIGIWTIGIIYFVQIVVNLLNFVFSKVQFKVCSLNRLKRIKQLSCICN